MSAIQRFLSIVFSEMVIKKLVAFGLLYIFGYILRDFLAIFFITFLFAYIFLELGTLFATKLHHWGITGKKDTPHRIALRYSTTNHMVSILYIIFIGIVIFMFSNILPQIGVEIKNFIESAPSITAQAQEFITKIETMSRLDLGLEKIAADFMNPKNIETIGQGTIASITNAGIFLTKFLIALILSYIFIIERMKIAKFLSRIKEGNFSFLYDEWAIVSRKVGTGFGMIFKAQSIIAFVNAVLTSFGLLLISFFHGGEAFPYIFTLSLVVFIFGFIPVFGTFLSGTPILIIGYGYGANIQEGLLVVTAIIAMIIIVHTIETYYLNPKIVGSYMHFPVFITLLILLISEHFFGIVGLLIGVPIFSILLSFFEDVDGYISEIKKQLYG